MFWSIVRILVALAVVSFMLAASVGHSEADGPVNPSVIEADLPTSNADGSPLTDLDVIVFCVASSPTASPVSCVDVDSPTPSPTGTVTVSSPIAAWGLIADAQYYGYAYAADFASNRSAETTRVPFEWNRQSPAAPSMPRYR